MKRILFLMAVLFSLAACQPVNGQSTSPRFGTTAGKDQTYRTLKLGYTTVTDAAGNDTTALVPTKFKNYVRIAATDSCSLSTSTTYAYAGDEIVLIVTGDSGDKVKLIGSGWTSAGTATLSSSGAAVITFVFSGAKWVEKSRVVQ